MNQNILTQISVFVQQNIGYLPTIVALSIGLWFFVKLLPVRFPKEVQFFPGEDYQTWVKLSDLARYKKTDVVKLWKTHFADWKIGSGYVYVAFKLQGDLFIGGVTIDGKVYPGRYILGSRWAFYRNLSNVYIMTNDAEKLM